MTGGTKARRFALVPLSAAMARTLHACGLRVLIAICASVDACNCAWPGVTEIARRTGIPRGKIPALVKKIEATGLITVERQLGGGNIYGVNYDAVLSPSTETPPVPLQRDTTPSPPKGTGVPLQGCEVSPYRGTKQNRADKNEEADASSRQVVVQLSEVTQESGDLKGAVFDQGRIWLMSAAGITDTAARKLLGKWRRDHGDARVVEVLIAARDMRPSDPIAWIEAALKARAGARSRFDPPPFRRGDIL